MNMRSAQLLGVAGLMTAVITLWGTHAMGAGGAAPSPAPTSAAPTTTAPAPAPKAGPTAAAPVKPAAPAPAHAGFVEDMDCSACHSPDGWKLAQSAGQSGFDHDRTGFPLRSSHKQTACAGCHTGTAKPANACSSCHRDSHQARLGQQCEECHRSTTWKDTSALERHRLTRLPLTGRHATAECVSCHKRGAERTFSDAPVDCYSCHSGLYHDPNPPHVDHDGDPADPSILPLPRDCSLCHRPTGWKPVVFVPGMLRTGLNARLRNPAAARQGGLMLAAGVADRIEHDAMFEISSGKHRSAVCESCHTDTRRPKAVRCDGCHQGAALRKQHRGPVSRAAAACLSCHPRGGAR